MRIFIDMDEVVADFKSYASWVRGRSVEDVLLTNEDWVHLREHQRLYRDLSVRQDARELVSYLMDYAQGRDHVFLAFLTAVPSKNDMPWAFTDKVFWAQKHFPDIPVWFGPYSVDKHRHCRPGDILIDDRKSNCNAWVAAQGRAHIYRTWPACHAWLEGILPR